MNPLSDEPKIFLHFLGCFSLPFRNILVLCNHICQFFYYFLSY
jgi:hypothetical protein